MDSNTQSAITLITIIAGSVAIIKEAVQLGTKLIEYATERVKYKAAITTTATVPAEEAAKDTADSASVKRRILRYLWRNSKFVLSLWLLTLAVLLWASSSSEPPTNRTVFLVVLAAVDFHALPVLIVIEMSLAVKSGKL